MLQHSTFIKLPFVIKIFILSFFGWPFYCISLFTKLLGKETEKFGGDTLLNGQEQLHQIKQQMDGWTDSALRVFSRHKGLEGRQHPDQVAMVKLNEVRPAKYLLTLKAPPIICSRRQFKILPLFQN